MDNSLRCKLRSQRIFMDGAFGTYAQALGLTDSHFKDVPGCMEYLSESSADLVSKIHTDYLEAGSDAVETNTFGGNYLKLGEYGLEKRVYDLNLSSTRIARKAADEFSTPSRRRFVIGTMGPTGRLPSSTDEVLGNVTYGQLKKMFFDQALGIIDGGADALLVETGQDLLEMKAAVNGAKGAAKEKRKDIVVMAQCTLANNGRMLLGTEVSAMIASLGYLGVDVMGINCSTGPVEMEKVIEFMGKNCPVYVSCAPNAGLPFEVNGKTVYNLAPEEMGRIMGGFASKYRLNMIGGCCGTTPEHIRSLIGSVSSQEKRTAGKKRYYSSFYKGFNVDAAVRPMKIGERVNTQGSRKIKELLKAEDYDNIVEIGKLQEKAGADILDICTVLTERPTEKRDAVILVKRIAESVVVPVMIDSTNIDVIEGALENFPGTAFINSVNLEDGGKKAEKVFSMASEHGSFIVNLVIDEKGMGNTPERKIEIAERLYRKAVDEYGIEPHRMIFDMLTFTLGTGEKEYADSAVKTYEGIKLLKDKCPGALSVLGVSNVSFGLPGTARKVLNNVYMYHAVMAGLDMAIINPADVVDYDDIDTEEKALSEDLIFSRRDDALERLVDHFSAKNTVDAPPGAGFDINSLSVEERLSKCIFDRDKAGIIDAVNAAMQKYSPKEIINDLLMASMREVGEKLDSGEMVLPYVLQSAEVMRKAIEYLEGFMEKGTSSSRGKVILATVFGDVHDIGKNLVKMILNNNGFNVIDMGKQVPVKRIVEEAEKNDVDAVGLSALLVSTAGHMRTCVREMHEAGLEYPVIIGGAPTNKRFAMDISLQEEGGFYSGGVFYARDAFTGLKIIQALTDPAEKRSIMDSYREQFGETPDIGGRPSEGLRTELHEKKGHIPVHKNINAPFYGVRVLNSLPVDEVFPYIDKRMLFGLSWGMKLKDENEKRRIIAEEYEPMLEVFKEESVRKGWLDLRAVYGYFKCRAHGESIEVMDGQENILGKIDFKREHAGKRRSLADYFYNGHDGYDVAAFQAVTAGPGITAAMEELEKEKESTKAFLLHGFGVNMAEAAAAYTHDKIRKELGLGIDAGKRYSPGYPLWENIRDQRIIFDLLDVEKMIGVSLTEGYQMVPEQSTTAIIVHNESAEY